MNKLLALLCTIVWIHSHGQQIKPFASDGCSMFPDKLNKLGLNWCTCCVEHDIAYWQGGTRTQRDSADSCLRECVYAYTLNAFLADAMYRGVAVGGGAFFPSWYRWGYGWEYGRGYDSLGCDEKEHAQIYLDKYFSEQLADPCR